MTLGAGARLGGRYRLDVRIGAGGMGEVWRGTDEVLRRTVAVKVMLPSVATDPGFAQRFLSEATAMARVNHPAVASIHDYGTDAGVSYLVMEFVEGESLGGLLSRVGRLGPADTMRIIAQAADALQAVHAAGLVHRDVKPANLLLRRDGQVVITDFGISRSADASRLTAAGEILGTPSYLSPEQVLGHPTGPLTDVYALGLTAYECLTGRKPFEAENPYAVAIQRVHQPPPPIDVALPPAVRAVVDRALAVDPGQRWPSATAMANAARATNGQSTTPDIQPTAIATTARLDDSAPSGAPFPTQPSFPTGPSGPSRGRRVAIVAALLTALALLMVGAGIAIRGLDKYDKPVAGVSTATKPAPSRSAAKPAANNHSTTKPAPSTRGASTPATSSVPAGFQSCGNNLCPTTEMCWGGITLVGGRVVPPRSKDCREAHYRQTFAAIPLPGDINLYDVDLDALVKRPDVASACSRALLQERSRNPDRTAAWTIDAWPIPTPIGSSTNYLHCVAGHGETRGSAF